MTSDRARGVAALVLAAALFGITFVVVKEALSEARPLAFVGWRFLVGGLVLLSLNIPTSRGVWRDGAIAGLWLFAGYAFQTAGLTTTGASNSALLTGLYPVFTPLLAAAWRRRPPSPWAVVGVVLGFFGTALLTATQGVELGRGDILTIACAVAFAGHVVTVSRMAGRHPVIPFTTTQLLTTAALGLIGSVVFEGPGLPPRSTWASIVLLGIGVSGAAYLLQVWAQTRIGPSQTAIILTLEPVFGVAAAAVLLGERLTVSGWFGAAIILGAVYLVLTRVDDEPVVEAEAISPV